MPVPATSARTTQDPVHRARLHRRGHVLAALACVLALAGCSSDTGSPAGSSPSEPTRAGSPSPEQSTSTAAGSTESPSATPSTSPTASEQSPSSQEPVQCPADLTLQEEVGQLFMMGVSGSGPTKAELDAVAATHTGGVVLVGNSQASVDQTAEYTDAVRQASSGPEGVELLVGADQEGGQVQRLSGPGFSDIPSAATQATLSDQELRRQAQQWGEELRQAGVTVDLAPVADVVPASVGEQNKPIAALGRGYGSDPQQVSDKVTAFIKGMAAAGEATAVKHFPGLGTVTGNTDFADHVVDTTTTRDSELLTGFDAAIEAGANMVMISTAYYTQIDPDHPAAFSDEVITGMLRQDRGYDGVVISDDLGAAKAVADWAPGERAVKFLQAGGDLIINVEPDSTDDMIDAVLAKAQQDSDFAERVHQSARRVLDLKTDLGLTDCD